jgi:hypothetical protein
LYRNTYIEGLNYELPHPFKKQSDRLDKEFDTDATVDSDGVARWKSNNNVPPNDILEFWKYLNKPFDYEKSNEVRIFESQKFIEEYRNSRANYEPSEEELFEMRAAFGPGEKVMDIFTGKITQL